MIDIDRLTKIHPATRTCPAVTALDSISLSIEPGTVHGIIGASGSGKTTLARCLTLLSHPTSGRITIDGQDLTSLRGAGLREARRQLGVVFQHFNLLDSRTALHNVEFPLEVGKVPARERRAIATGLLERVGLGDKLGSHPAQLSGGQQQRVAIARALAASPRVLVCDEATSALDPASTAQILDLIRELTDELGLTTILITHEMSVVRRICDRVDLLDHGTVAHSGTPEDVLPLVEVAA